MVALRNLAVILGLSMCQGCLLGDPFAAGLSRIQDLSGQLAVRECRCLWETFGYDSRDACLEDRRPDPTVQACIGERIESEAGWILKDKYADIIRAKQRRLERMGDTLGALVSCLDRFECDEFPDPAGTCYETVQGSSYESDRSWLAKKAETCD